MGEANNFFVQEIGSKYLFLENEVITLLVLRVNSYLSFLFEYR